VVSDEEFERLDPDLKKTLKAKGDLLLEEMGTALRRLSKEERGYHDREKDLDRETAGEVLAARLEEFTELREQNPAIAQYLDALRADILDNLDAFMPRDASQAAPNPPAVHGRPVPARGHLLPLRGQPVRG